MDRSSWRIVGQTYEVVLRPWGSAHEGGACLEPRAAMRALDTLLTAGPSWGLAAQALTEAARDVSRRRGLPPPGSFAAARAVVRDAIATGLITAWRVERRASAAPAPTELDTDAVDRIPLATSLLERTWIEIELTDMEGNPMIGERYWIKLPDGKVREGALDRFGRAYFGDLDPGACEIRWPDRDDDATVPAERVSALGAQPPERTWVEIELTDMEGNPRPNERYSITLPDGTVREGCLDAKGRAHFGNLDPGLCQVRWPDLDDDAHTPEIDVTVAQPERGASRRSPAAEAQALRQAQALAAAAQEGVPFCEECARARAGAA